MTPTDKPSLLELLWQSLHDIEGGYNLLAPKFDQSPFVTPEIILDTFFERLKKEVHSIEEAIDICCGTGAASLYLLPLCQSEMTALDISEGMLEECERKLRLTNSSQDIRMVRADALDMPFNERFDLAVSFGAFGHIPHGETRHFVRQVHRILKSGGKFCFITTYRLPYFSKGYVTQKFFNLGMHLRNFLIRPKFIMYYLTFILPEIKTVLESEGFEVKVIDSLFDQEKHRRFKYYIPLKDYCMVVATKL